MSRSTPVVRRVGPEAAADVLAVVHAAFEARPPLDPPAPALAETEESIARALADGGGLLATLDDEPVAALIFEDPGEGPVWLRRVGVVPAGQHHGLGPALVTHAAEAFPGRELAVAAREELPRTVDFWRHQAFRIDPAASTTPHLVLRRPAEVRVHEIPDADAMRELGGALARELRAGDLVLLTGELGAGKTTFTQGLGAGLGVRGDVTSPTFVISRVHPNPTGGPLLVHVDAYRIGGIQELDDLDLDASLDDAVTVVEWGDGMAEGLAESRLEVRIMRALAEASNDELDPRRVFVSPVGPRWVHETATG